jgi:hypothetical protein
MGGKTVKIWFGHCSEHSANLVMIGWFKEVGDATKAKQIIEMLTEQLRADEHENLIKIGERADRYTNGMLNLLGKLNVYSIGPTEVEQFAYDVTIQVENNELVLTTDEIDVSAFLKVLIDKGARVEVYSAHDYPDIEEGRGN